MNALNKTMDNITPRDRLSFTLFLALSVHAAIILGVGFTWHMERRSSPTIEVTLAQHRDEHAPERADFIADANQIGSGSAEDVVEKTATEEADFHDTTHRELRSLPTLERTDPVESHALLTTRSASERRASVTEPTEEMRLALPPSPDLRQLDLSKEIASLEARLDTERNDDARAPRVRRLTSVSATRTEDAYYLAAWRRKVESIGNLNYPEEARERQLYGSLRLLVAITPDGGLKEVKLLESSGHPVLDEAALRIVRLAAPFAPFPEEMRRSTDVLEIVRTWEFRKNRYSAS